MGSYLFNKKETKKKEKEKHDKGKKNLTFYPSPLLFN